jgi:Uma2 family endonuclease
MVATPLQLNVSNLHLTDEQFYQMCLANPDSRIELTAQGILVVMTPIGGESGHREADLIIDLGVWNRRTQLGKVFSSSTVFKLPLGSQRSPDAAWIELSRWQSLSLEQQQRFPPIAPDFVMELRSRTDNLRDLQDKMQEYMDNGVRLGFLLNPADRQAEIYRLDREPELLTAPDNLNGESVLPGFVLDLRNFWT